MTPDSASVGNTLLQNREDHVGGLGGEVSFFLPKPKLLLGLRVVPEFGAINRTQGFTYMLTVGCQAKSLVKPPHP